MKNPTLKEVIKAIQKMNRKGFKCHFEGKGDGSVKLIIENKTLIKS